VKGLTAKLAADTVAEVSGSATTKVTSSGILILQGSLTKIN
jgi:hypothetical protein